MTWPLPWMRYCACCAPRHDAAAFDKGRRGCRVRRVLKRRHATSALSFLRPPFLAPARRPEAQITVVSALASRVLCATRAAMQPSPHASAWAPPPQARRRCTTERCSSAARMLSRFAHAQAVPGVVAPGWSAQPSQVRRVQATTRASAPVLTRHPAARVLWAATGGVRRGHRAPAPGRWR